jgi:ribosomal protein S27AE
MAVFKANYTRSRGAAKAYIRYITHRPGIDGERTTRELFGADGRLTKLQAYRTIDYGRRKTVFYRLVVSPDPKGEDGGKDLDLREVTEQTMMQLQDRFGGTNIQFLAAIHADHTSKRHVHILALVPGRLKKSDLQALRGAATESSRSQRQDRDRHLAAESQRNHRPRTPVRVSGSRGAFEKSGSGSVRPLRQGPTCPNCGPGSEMEQRGRLFECANCGLAARRSFSQGMEIVKHPGLELALEEVGNP